MFNHDFLTPAGLVRQTHNGKRYYQTEDGNRYPSITTILSEATEKSQTLINWEKRVGKVAATKIKNQAASKGTSLHTICEKYLLNESYLDKAMPLTIESFNLIKPFIDSNVNNIKGIEFPLFSDKFKIAGTTDLICEYDNELAILDFKTARKAKREDWIKNYFLQATMYSICLYEKYGLRAKKIVLLVAVESNKSQVFIKDPKDYIEEAIKIIKKYHSMYP